MKKNHKIIAIIGGMGSASSLFLQEKILQTAVLTKKMESDGDYPDIIHVSLPSGIPDRSDFLLAKSASNPALIVHDFLTGLERMAEVLHREMMAVIACNTFHAPPIWDVLSKMSFDNPHPKVELLHFVDIVAGEYAKSFDEKKLGILSTAGERKLGIYKKILEKYDITCIQTNEEEQEKLQRCIYNIKKNPIPQPDDLRVIHDILKNFLSQGANNVILGCTELSMIKTTITWQGGLIDPIEILSKKLIRMTGE